MRIPIYVTIPACMIVAVLVFWLGSRNKDFTTPPTPERLVEISKEWEESRPNIPPPKPINTLLTKDPALITPQNSTIPKKEEVKTLSPGDLHLAPSLAEYGTYREEGSDALIKLATFLETKAEYQRALLAWERVLDSSTPDEEQRSLAQRSIQRLHNSLPPWNPDPKADISVTLHAGATLKEKKVLIEALETSAALISEISGNILKVDIKASFGKSSTIKTPSIPVAIWFSRPESIKSPMAETPPISFMADPNQPEALKSQVVASVYALIRAHLTAETSFTPLPEYQPHTKFDDLLRHHVTRLMWREFVRSMKG